MSRDLCGTKTAAGDFNHFMYSQVTQVLVDYIVI